jgi:hypothetical protein
MAMRLPPDTINVEVSSRFAAASLKVQTGRDGNRFFCSRYLRTFSLWKVLYGKDTSV